MMNKWLKYIFAIVILFFLVLYLSKHWGQLKGLLDFSFAQLAGLMVLCFLATLNSSMVVKLMLGSLKVKTHLWDMFLVHNAAVLLNYVPMKFGTLFRASYLKKHYGLKYTQFATFFVYLTILMTVVAAALGLVLLLIFHGLGDHEKKIFAGIFLVILLVLLVFLKFPLPIPNGSGRISVLLRNFLVGRNQMSADIKTNLAAALFLMLTFLITGLRIGIIYSCLGYSLGLSSYVILGVIGFVVLFIGLTPGSLGIRELFLGFGAMALGAPLEIGLFVATIDRAVALVYSILIGGGCVIWIWFKSPSDLKKSEILELSTDNKI